MRILRDKNGDAIQDIDGCLIVDGEGEEVLISHSIPVENPLIMSNFVIKDSPRRKMSKSAQNFMAGYCDRYYEERS